MAPQPRHEYNTPMDQERATSRAGRIVGWLAAFALAVLVWKLLIVSFDRIPHDAESDDGYYLRYMRDVAEGGLSAFPELFQFYLGDRAHWIFPPPSRVGFIWVSALWSEMFGLSLQSLSYLSLASHLALIPLVYAFAQRWFEVQKALLVTALIGFSPLLLGMSRLALTDSFITLSQVVSIGLYFEYVRDPSRWWKRIAWASAFTFAVLTKEISVMLALPFAAHAAVERFYVRRPIPIVATIALIAGPVCVAIGVWVLAAGGPGVLYDVMKIVLLSPATNEYALQWGSGGWYRYPIDEIMMSPWPTFAGLAGVAIAFWRWRRGEYGSLAVLMALVYVMQLASLGSFTKNLRYIMVLEFPLRVLAVILLWEICNAARSKVGRAACALLVVILCFGGWRDYREVWLRWQTYDPVTHLLTGIRGFWPAKPPRIR